MSWGDIFTWGCANWGICLGGGGSGNSVPELSLTAGPIALAIIVAIVAIGLERRRHHKGKKESE